MKSFSFLLPILFFISCNHQNTTEHSAGNTTPIKNTQARQPVINLLPNDPVLSDLRDTVSKQGPQNITRGILQDRKGIIWFASWQGIIQYDGSNFTNVTLKEGLGHYPYCSVMEDLNGNLWFGTMGKGLYRYDGKNFTHFTTDYGLAGNSVYCMLEDKSGNLWFGTDGGISRYSQNTFDAFTIKNGLPDNIVYCLLQDSKGVLWIGTKGGVCTYLPAQITKDAAPKFTQQESPFGNIRAMINDKEGHVWLGTTSGGLCRYDGKNYTCFTVKDGLSSNYVGCLMEDKKGNIWCGGDVYRYDGRSFTHVIVKEDQSCNTVFCISEDNNGNIWFGTSSGVCRYTNGKAFEYFKK